MTRSSYIFILVFIFYVLAGSRYWQGGNFEVTKNTTLPSEQPEGWTGPQSPLQVIIPSELDGASYIQVEVKSVSGNVMFSI